MEKPLNTLAIHRFRGLDELRLEGLGAANVFVGDNNAGKTSVLEAIAVFCRPFDHRQWLRAISARGAQGSRLDALRWMFPRVPATNAGEPSQGPILISGTGTYDVEAVEVACEPVTRTISEPIFGPDSETEPVDFGEYEEQGLELRISVRLRPGAPLEAGIAQAPGTLSRAIRFWEAGMGSQGEPEGPALPVRTITPNLHREAQFQLAQRLSEARIEGWKERSLGVLRMFDPDVRNLETLTPPGRGVAVMVDHARIGLAPVSVFGDGLRKALVIALILPRVADGVLLIDEIESSVHPSVLGRVFSWVVDACARLRVQLFVTTHSLEAVDAIVGASDNRLEEVVGFRLEADRMGSRSQRFSGELLQRLRQERGLDIR